MFFQCINIRQVPLEVLKTAAFGHGFQHLHRDLANVNVWKNMFDTYIITHSWSRYDFNVNERGVKHHNIICFFIVVW